jgi:hypothetical protein
MYRHNAWVLETRRQAHLYLETRSRPGIDALEALERDGSAKPAILSSKDHPYPSTSDFALQAVELRRHRLKLG